MRGPKITAPTNAATPLLVENCVNEASVTGTGSTSGIIGAGTSAYPAIQLVNCLNSGDITGAPATAFCSWINRSGSSVTGCLNTGNIIGADNCGSKFGVALFLIQFVMMALQAHALKRYMDIVPLWLSTLFFNLYFFNLNLNLMCQGVACAFFLWSLKFYETREFMKLLLCAVVCFFIHKSSSVAYFILFGFAFIVGRPVEKQPRLLILLALA